MFDTFWWAATFLTSPYMKAWGKRILVLRNDQLSTKKHCRTHDWPKERRKINRNFSLSIQLEIHGIFLKLRSSYMFCVQKCPWFHHYTGSFYDLNLSKTTEKKGWLTNSPTHWISGRVNDHHGTTTISQGQQRLICFNHGTLHLNGWRGWKIWPPSRQLAYHIPGEKGKSSTQKWPRL